MEERVHNFNAGPAALPLEVLEEIRNSFLNFKGTGMSIIETSHRAVAFDEVIHDTVERTKRLLKLGDEFSVLFIQGGASHQFCMIPMNLSLPNKPLDYINTGTWSTKAIKEARIQAEDVRVIASSEDKNFSYLPSGFTVDKDASFLHFTSNNTIKGTQWKTYPDGGDVPLICDMSSDFMSHPVDTRSFGLIYAGAQKNCGPAGVALVIIRDDMLKRIPKNLPTILSYATYKDNNSLFNTPPTFAIYVIDLVLTWLEDTIGGLEEMERINKEKASLLYETIDESKLFKGTTDRSCRSMMNVTFRLTDEGLEKKFLSDATKRGFVGVKGHKSVGGCRASIYNAVTIESVKSLANFMKEFEGANA
jgi:phosphoserine aminotransferase